MNAEANRKELELAKLREEVGVMKQNIVGQSAFIGILDQDKKDLQETIDELKKSKDAKVQKEVGVAKEAIRTKMKNLETEVTTVINAHNDLIVGRQCKVCMIEVANCAFATCKHMCICAGCKIRYWDIKLAAAMNADPPVAIEDFTIGCILCRTMSTEIIGPFFM